jgi:cell division protein FtsL
MNTTTRTFTNTGTKSREVSLAIPVLPLPKIHFLTLILVILLSAFMLVYTKDVNRRMLIGYQQTQTENIHLISEQNKLLLEQSSLVAPTLVQQMAERKLNMELPLNKDIVILKKV